MPETVLEQLDKSPKDQQVDMKEIQDALKEWFFDKEENIKSLKEELDIWVDKLKESFMNSLTIYKNDLVKKNIQDLSSGEIKILQLYANYKLQENFNIDGKLSSHLTEVMALWNDEYLKHIWLILHIEDKKVKDLLCKTSFRELDEATIMSLTETDIPTFITININEYPLEIQNKLLINIQCLLLEWNGLFPNSTMRQNSGTLLDIKNNSDYQKRVNKSFAAMYADKQKFLDGSVSATDFTKYKQGYDLTKYDGNPFYSAFKQLLSTMSQESGASKNIDLAPLYVSWAKLWQNFLTSFFFKVIENRSEDAGESNGENIRETIYFEFIGYTLKDVITQVDADIDGSGKKTKISIMKEDYYRKYPGQSLSAYQQKIFAGTRYGKSLQSATDRRYSNHFWDKEKQKQYDLDEKLIQEYGKTVTTLEKEVKYWKQKSETATLWWVDKTGIYFQNYTKACEKLTKDGNRAFVAMILQLNLYGLPDNSINALSKGDQTFAKLIKQHYTALQNGVKNQYKGETKLPAPIWTADYMIDYTQQTTEVRTSTRGIMQGNKATSYAGDSERVKKHVDRMIRDTVWAHIEDIMMDVEKHPEKFFIDVAAIVAAWAITGLTGWWWWMLVQAALFTASHTALSWLGQGILEVNEGWNFLEGVGKWSGFLSQVAKPDGTVTWEFNASDVIENKIWEYGTNIILFGPVGKFGHVAERGALTLIEKDAVMKGTESFIAKLWLEQAWAKTLGLLAEAWLFTWFNAVMGSARQWFDAKSRADATEIGNLAAGFVHNIMFIGALKLWNFATSSFQEKIAGKSLTNASKKGQAEVEGLNNEYNIKLKELKDLYQIEPTKIGGEVKFMKNGQEVPDGELYKMSNIKDIQNKIIEAEKNLVNIQVQITTKTQEFTNKPEVKNYNEFIDEYDLRRETLTPESIIDLRIKSAEKVKDVVKIEELKKLKEELQTYQTQYNIILDATIKGTQDISMPTEQQVDETQTTIDPTIVKTNSLNSDKLIIDGKINLEAKNNIEQILRESKVLWEKETLTDEQIRRIYEAHNLPWELYNLNFWETRAKMEKLLEANFSKEQIRVLMDNGICGEVSEIVASGLVGGDADITEIDVKADNVTRLRDAGFVISEHEIEKVSKYPPETINNILLLKDAGFEISTYYFKDISKCSEITIKNIISLKKAKIDIGINYLNTLSEYDNDPVLINNSIALKKAGFDVEYYYLGDIVKYGQDMIDAAIVGAKNLKDNGIKKGLKISSIDEVAKITANKVECIKLLKPYCVEEYDVKRLLECSEIILESMLKVKDHTPDSKLSILQLRKLARWMTTYGEVVYNILDSWVLELLSSYKENEVFWDGFFESELEDLIRGLNWSKQRIVEFSEFSKRVIDKFWYKTLEEKEIGCFGLLKVFEWKEGKRDAIIDTYMEFFDKLNGKAKESYNLNSWLRDQNELEAHLGSMDNINEYFALLTSEKANINTWTLLYLLGKFTSEQVKWILKMYNIYVSNRWDYRKSFSDFWDRWIGQKNLTESQFSAMIDSYKEFQEVSGMRKDGFGLEYFLILSSLGMDVPWYVEKLSVKWINNISDILTQLSRIETKESLLEISNYMLENTKNTNKDPFYRYNESDLKKMIEVSSIKSKEFSTVKGLVEFLDGIEAKSPDLRELLGKYPDLIDAMAKIDRNAVDFQKEVNKVLFRQFVTAGNLDVFSWDFISKFNYSTLDTDFLSQVINEKLSDKSDNKGIENNTAYCINLLTKIWRIDVLEKFTTQENAERLLTFKNTYIVGNKWETIIALSTLLIMKYNPGFSINECLDMTSKEVSQFQKKIDNKTIVVPEWLSTSVWMEYEVIKTLGERYEDFSDWKYVEDANYTCLLAQMGMDNRPSTEWQIFEYALKPTDNPYVALLELKLLHDLDLINFNKEYLHDAKTITTRNAGTGFHITLGGEYGISGTETAKPFHNLLQNILSGSGWAWINISQEDLVSGSYWHKWNINYRWSKADRRGGNNVIPVFENGNNSAAEFRLYSFDGVESFERTILTNYFSAVWLQALEKYTTITPEVIKELSQVDLNEDTFVSLLEQKGLLKESIKDPKISKTIFNMVTLQCDVERAIENHNVNFFENALVVKNNFRDLVNKWAIEWFTKEDVSSDDKVRESLKKYVSEEMSIKFEDIYKDDPRLSNVFRRINQLFLKDETNANSYFSRTKDIITNQEENTSRTLYEKSLFDKRDDEIRSGYYYIQGWMDNLIVHEMQKGLLKYLENMQETLK